MKLLSVSPRARKGKTALDTDEGTGYVKATTWTSCYV